MVGHRDLAVLCDIQHLLVRTELRDNMTTENTKNAPLPLLEEETFLIDNRGKFSYLGADNCSVVCKIKCSFTLNQ